MAPYASAATQLRDLASRKVSARELLDAAVARNEALKTRVNAVVRFDIERARRDADAVDRGRVRGDILGPLAGLPMTVKEALDMEGLPASAANPAWMKRAAGTSDSEMVRRLRAAGAVVWGKTNVPFMLGDYQSFNPNWGTTNNPYAVDRTCGGSSGGGAAAVASGITALEVGSDLGGSIRTPASFCGVVGLKPTWGMLSLAGHLPPGPDHPRETDLAVVGPIARTTSDLRLLWRELCGATFLIAPTSPPRIAVVKEEPGFPVALAIQDTINAVAESLARDGCTISAERPNFSFSEALEIYLRLVLPIIGADLPGFMYRIGQATGIARKLLRFRNVDIGGRFSLLGLTSISHRDWLLADSRRWIMRREIARFFETHDAILMPVGPVWAFPHDHKADFFSRSLIVDGKPHPYFSMLCWIAWANVLGLPAITVRAGTAPDGMPIGAQIVGPHGSEERLIDLAARIERLGGGFQQPPL